MPLLLAYSAPPQPATQKCHPRTQKHPSARDPSSWRDAVFLTWLVGDERNDVPAHRPGQRGLVDGPEVGAPAGDEHRQPLPPPGPAGVAAALRRRAGPEGARVRAPGQLAPDGAGPAARR